MRWTAALPRNVWKGAQILDAGCGIGRNSHWAMLEGAAGGVAFDIDDRSLALARKNLKSYPTINVAISPFTTFQKKITLTSRSRLVSSTILPNLKRRYASSPVQSNPVAMF